MCIAAWLGQNVTLQKAKGAQCSEDNILASH